MTDDTRVSQTLFRDTVDVQRPGMMATWSCDHIGSVILFYR